MAALQRSFRITSSFLRPIARFSSTDSPVTDALAPDVDDDKLGPTVGSLPFIIEKSVNKVTLMGRVGKKPEKQGSRAKQATVFSLATNSMEIDENGDSKKITDWHRVAVFKPYLQETVYNYLEKGQRCIVQGKLTYNEVRDFEGAYHPSTTIFADQVVFLGKKTQAKDTKEM